jgi:hypothetical protein
MTHWFLKNGHRTIRFTVSFLLIVAVCRVRAQDFFAGVRGGASLDDNAEFREAEAFGGLYFCRWHIYSNWFLRPGADGSVGWVGNRNDNAFIGTLGPLAELGKGRFPLTLEGGAAPTFLSRHHFSSRDFGDNFQFTSHLGLNWRFTDHFSLGVRFQHMSNAGISHTNPGLNMEMLTLRFDF